MDNDADEFIQSQVAAMSANVNDDDAADKESEEKATVDIASARLNFYQHKRKVNAALPFPYPFSFIMALISDIQIGVLHKQNRLQAILDKQAAI